MELNWPMAAVIVSLLCFLLCLIVAGLIIIAMRLEARKVELAKERNKTARPIFVPKRTEQ
jgi:hypothetical protein